MTDSQLATVPEVEVDPKARRWQFRANYKQDILRRADVCKAPGALGELLGSEGLYSSHLSTWRKQRDTGELAGLSPRKRGRKRREVDARDRKIVEPAREIAKLTARAERAEALVELQKKVAVSSIGQGNLFWKTSDGDRKPSVFLGKYCRRSRSVFSLVPRCQGLRGSQKYTFTSAAMLRALCWAISGPRQRYAQDRGAGAADRRRTQSLLSGGRHGAGAPAAVQRRGHPDRAGERPARASCDLPHARSDDPDHDRRSLAGHGGPEAVCGRSHHGARTAGVPLPRVDRTTPLWVVSVGETEQGSWDLAVDSRQDGDLFKLQGSATPPSGEADRAQFSLRLPLAFARALPESAVALGIRGVVAAVAATGGLASVAGTVSVPLRPTTSAKDGGAR